MRVPSQGYALVIQDARGRFNAEGEFYGVAYEGRLREDRIGAIDGRCGTFAHFLSRDGPRLQQWQRAPYDNDRLAHPNAHGRREKNMRFGIGGYALERVETHGGAVAGRDLLADAVLAEALGFDSLWVAENHFSVDRQCSSPFVIAGVLAGATRRIRIGVFSMLTFAHPVRVAEDAATLDLMSDGRLMLCFGTGYRPEEFAAFGIAMDGKGARFRECLRVVQKAWAGPFVHHGKHFHIPMAVAGATTAVGEVTVLPQPLQAAIPLWIAAFGNVGVKRAAHLGYPLLPAALESIPELQAKYQLYHTTWQAAERTEPPAAMPLMRVVYVAPQAHTAHQEAEAGLMQTYGRYRRWGLLPNAGTDYTTLARDRFIIGDPAQVLEEIQRYRELFGITDLICRMAMPAIPHDRIARSMHLFSERIAPYVG
jgi:alkanesulfonate monooxygenase SsuD/methylene tetrahydromethanopterin reductase-like flavin-dependent oxidoreductase (luciferase family)